MGTAPSSLWVTCACFFGTAGSRLTLSCVICCSRLVAAGASCDPFKTASRQDPAAGHSASRPAWSATCSMRRSLPRLWAVTSGCSGACGLHRLKCQTSLACLVSQLVYAQVLAAPLGCHIWMLRRLRPAQAEMSDFGLPGQPPGQCAGPSHASELSHLGAPALAACTG